MSESEAGTTTPALTKRERKALARIEHERIRKLKEEILDFPVFQQEEVLPLKYYIHQDIYEILKKRRRAEKGFITKPEKTELKTVIQAVLKKYCKRKVYFQAAILKGKRYHLDASEEYGICAGDMEGFKGFLAMCQNHSRELSSGDL